MRQLASFGLFVAVGLGCLTTVAATSSGCNPPRKGDEVEAAVPDKEGCYFYVEGAFHRLSMDKEACKSLMLALEYVRHASRGAAQAELNRNNFWRLFAHFERGTASAVRDQLMDPTARLHVFYREGKAVLGMDAWSPHPTSCAWRSFFGVDLYCFNAVHAARSRVGRKPAVLKADTLRFILPELSLLIIANAKKAENMLVGGPVRPFDFTVANGAPFIDWSVPEVVRSSPVVTSLYPGNVPELCQGAAAQAQTPPVSTRKFVAVCAKMLQDTGPSTNFRSMDLGSLPLWQKYLLHNAGLLYHEVNHHHGCRSSNHRVYGPTADGRCRGHIACEGIADSEGRGLDLRTVNGSHMLFLYSVSTMGAEFRCDEREYAFLAAEDMRADRFCPPKPQVGYDRPAC